MRRATSNAQCKIPKAQCPMPNTRCPNAQCRVPHADSARSQLPRAQCKLQSPQIKNCVITRDSYAPLVLLIQGYTRKKAYLPTYLACNKDTKHFERFHSRKFSPKQQLEDVFYRLMHRSDPG